MMFRLSVSAIAFNQTLVFENNGAAQQINGREGETATFIWRCPSNFSLRVFGFAPRQFNRWIASRLLTKVIWHSEID